MVIQILGVEALELTHVADGLHWFFSLFPHYSLAYAISRLSTISDMIDICDTLLEVCQDLPDFCLIPPECRKSFVHQVRCFNDIKSSFQRVR